MSTTTKKPAAAPARKATARRPAKSSKKPTTFAEWAKSVAGMVDTGQHDLSTREGFGH
ncbi:MAG: hypothetical protein WC661_17210 [Opitutaceae bacterium]|jgi:hypothetical protein